MSKWLLTILFLVGSAFLTHLIPFSLFFRYLDTTVHEFGHAVVTLLLSGKVMSIELHQDRSGLTRAVLTQPWSTIPVGLAGYMTASLFAWLLFYLHAREKQRYGLLLISLIAILSLILFVRGAFGVTWLSFFIAGNAVVWLIAGKRLMNLYYLLVAFLSLEESVFSSFSLFLGSLVQPGAAGDAALLSQATGLPSPLWAGWFTVFSLWCAVWALQLFFKPLPKRLAKRRVRYERQP